MPIRFVISQLTYIRNKKVRPFVVNAGMTSGQPKVLDYLSFHEGCTQKQIAQGCGVEPATMSGIIDGLVKNGYIKKSVVKENRREYQVFLTEKGREKHLEIREKIEMLDNKVLNTFNEEERITFQSLLERYYAAWCDIDIE